MRLLASPTFVLVTAALLGGCGSDSTAGSAGAGGEGSTGMPAGGASSSTSPDPDTDAEDESSSSSGGDDASPLDDEGCEFLPSGEQTPEALEIAEAIETEIADLGRADDIALLDFGINLGAGQGGVDIFCVSLALHADWFASQDSFCVQDTDPEVVLAEVSEAVAGAPTLPSLAPLAEMEAAAEECVGPIAYVPCRGSLGFLNPAFDPAIVSFSIGEDDGECTYTATWANLDAGTAEMLACETDSNDTCDTEG